MDVTSDVVVVTEISRRSFIGLEESVNQICHSVVENDVPKLAGVDKVGGG